MYVSHSQCDRGSLTADCVSIVYMLNMQTSALMCCHLVGPFWVLLGFFGHALYQRALLVRAETVSACMKVCPYFSSLEIQS